MLPSVGPERESFIMECNSRHTFALRHTEGSRWDILGESDAQVFGGTLAECEFWLDQEERRERSRVPKLNWAGSAMAWFHSLSPRPAHSVTRKL